MVLIDSSVWIEVMRAGGDENLRARVIALIEAGTAAWCPAIRLELWPGAKGRKEVERLTELRTLVADLTITLEVWERAIQLAGRARSAGVNCPYPDLLVFACAQMHGVELLHQDRHMDSLAAL